MRAVLFILVVFFASPLAAQEEPHDPWESTNRGIFWFNDQVDTNLLRPIAKGYDAVVPDRVEKSITNFFHNLRYPRYLVCDLLEMRLKHAAHDTGRFLINSTVGLLGLFDVAEEWGLSERNKDVGLALQYQGVPAGPYIVLPFLGPSTVRDAIGTIFDYALDPLVIFGYSNVDAGTRDRIYYGATALKYVNLRSSLIEAIDAAKESSVDYYLFSQGAYYQYRWGELWDGEPPEPGEEVAETAAQNYRKKNLPAAASSDRTEILPPGAYE